MRRWRLQGSKMVTLPTVNRLAFTLVELLVVIGIEVGAITPMFHWVG